MIKKPLSPRLIGCRRFGGPGEHGSFTPPPFSEPSKIATKGVEIYDGKPLTLFDLSSHRRAREAIEFGLNMRHKDFHVFVVGEDRSGRMTATLSYLNNYIKDFAPPQDWVYLNNFECTHKPLPFPLPAGQGRILKERLQELITSVAIIIQKTFANPHYLRQKNLLTSNFQEQVENLHNQIQIFAQERGFELIQTEEGFSIEYQNSEESKSDPASVNEIKDRLDTMTLNIQLANQKVNGKLLELKRQTARKALGPLFNDFNKEFKQYLNGWVKSLKEDILKNVEAFEYSLEEHQSSLSLPEHILEYYTANVFVDHTESKHPKVFVEANPTYENLFGSIKYHSGPNGTETNFTMIRPGALHMANGGILVLRADVLAKNPSIWESLKSALRDRTIRIEERHRENTLPLLDAPEPEPIPLDVQVFLIASPYWYYAFYFNDPDFRSYFKIKADIDPDLPINQDNLAVYRTLIHQNAVALTGKDIEGDAVDYLTSYSSRWVENRDRLSAKFEQVADILIEASTVSQGKKIKSEDIKQAISLRRYRNSRIEDRQHGDIQNGQILIDVTGKRIGQINALTVMSVGDHEFGLPCRISARAYAGDGGVMNIDRMAEMSGPIQEKGALILEGFLNGLFAQEFPLSYSCSVTFEQSYVDVEGDSASLAELIAVISALSGIPIRQDVAITGSMNQFGQAQSVGGVHHKIEGFYRLCQERGLTGTQGVIIPRTNEPHLTLKDDPLESIRKNEFFIWTVDSIFEAIEIMLETPCGIAHEKGEIRQSSYPYYKFSKNSVFDKVYTQLKKYHKAKSKEQK